MLCFPASAAAVAKAARPAWVSMPHTPELFAVVPGFFRPYSLNTKLSGRQPARYNGERNKTYVILLRSLHRNK